MVKCPWCNGAMRYDKEKDEYHCIMCSRSDDLRHEKYVENEQKKEHERGKWWEHSKGIGRGRRRKMIEKK